MWSCLPASVSVAQVTCKDTLFNGRITFEPSDQAIMYRCELLLGCRVARLARARNTLLARERYMPVCEWCGLLWRDVSETR
jgi:hypothetical protein